VAGVSNLLSLRTWAVGFRFCFFLPTPLCAGTRRATRAHPKLPSGREVDY
jgi:hypothetical protein